MIDAHMLARLKAQMFLQSLRDTDKLEPESMARFTESMLRHLLTQAAPEPLLNAPQGAGKSSFLNAWIDIPLFAPSGETGRTLERDSLAIFADVCVFEWILERHDIDLNQTLIDAAPWPELNPLDWPWTSTFKSASCRQLPPALPPEIFVQSIASRPGILRATPGMLEQLASHVEKKTLSLPLTAVVAIGAPLSTEARQRLQAALKIPLIAIWYEPAAGIVGYDAPGETAWLPCEGTQYVEIVESDGGHARQGERGRAVVTSLYNVQRPAFRLLTGYSAIAVSGRDGHRRLLDPAPALPLPAC